jgi:glycosyltransferase involved in cell wall biosynthesis
LSNPELSIVVPCYNEEKNIPIIFEKFLRIVSDRNAEIILVNNGSTDKSEKVLTDLQGKFGSGKIRVVKIVKNEGYGYGILRGLSAGRGSVLAWTHADLQTDPEDVIKAYDLYKQSANGSGDIFVKGVRKNRKWIEAFFSWGMGVVSSIALNVTLTEINAQPKLFSRSFYEQYLMANGPFDFSLDLFAVYQAKTHCQIIEMPVFFKKRIHGEAKGGGSFKTRIKLIKRTMKYIAELRSKIQLSR